MNVRDEIRSLYPADSEFVLSGITRLLEKYKDVPAGHPHLTSQDAILITYGDAFHTEGSSPLDCLHRFAREQLGDSLSAVHLLPCFPYTSDDGFSVCDYYQIDPALGDWEDIERLGADYELMFDAVVNHISQASTWFQGFLSGDPAYQDFFIVSDPDADYSSVTRPRALPLLHPFDRGDEQVFVWTTFSQDQVDLNFSSAKVFLAVMDVLLFYLSKGARYIRLDAIAFIWKELGTTCMHLPQAHAIIQLYRHFIEQIAPHVVIITETNVPHPENVSYFGDGTNEAHMVYNFTLPPLLIDSLHQQDVSCLTDWARKLELPSDRVCFFNFTASHDGVGVRPLQGIVSDQRILQLAEVAKQHGGFVSMRDNGDGTQSPYEINCNYLDFCTDPNEQIELRANRFMLTQSVMLAMPGVPGIYYHSIIGSQNDRQAALDSGINRRINREKLDYEKLVAELNDPSTLRHHVYQRYRALLNARRSLAAMDPHAPASYEQQDRVFVIRRGQGKETIYALHNFSDSVATVEDLPAGLRDLVGGRSVPSNGYQLAPFEYRWLK